MKMKTIILLDLLLVFMLSADNTDIPNKIHIKYFGETKKSYVTSEWYYDGIPVTYSGNSKITITGQNTIDLRFKRTDLNWQGEETVIFNTGSKLDTAEVVCRLFDLPDTLLVRYGSNDPGTGFDLSEYFYGSQDSVDYHKNIEWSGNSKFDISKDGWKLVVKKRDESSLESEKVVFNIKATDSGVIYHDTITFICSNEQDPKNLKKYYIGDKYIYFSWFSKDLYFRQIIGTTILNNYLYYKLQYGNDSINLGLMRSTHNRVDGCHFTLETGDSIYLDGRQYHVVKAKEKLFDQDVLILKFVINGGSDEFLIETATKFGFVLDQTDQTKSQYDNHKGQHYGHALKGAIINGVHYGDTGINDGVIQNSLELKQNYPNPFNPSTMIQFSLAKPAMTELKVYNSRGEVVKTLIKGLCNAGNQQVQFDGSSLASGVYYYRLSTPEQSLSGKMMLIK